MPVQANLLACDAPAPFANGRVFNVGTGHSHTLNDLYAALASILTFRHDAKYGAVRAGDIPHSLANIQRATDELGYVPAVSFHEGLKQTAAWYVEQGTARLTMAHC